MVYLVTLFNLCSHHALKRVIPTALQVTSKESVDMARRLAREEGLLVGISSGASVCAAIRIAQRPENKGRLVVAIIARCFFKCDCVLH